MGDKGVSHMAALPMPTDSEFDNSDSDEGLGAAQGNGRANKANNKKLDNEGALAGAGSSGQTRIQKLIAAKMDENQNQLELISQKLQDLNDLHKIHNMQDLMKIDISKNYLDNIDILNNYQRLKVIIASDNYIRTVNLQLPKLQDLDLRNNFIEKVPILSQMPQLKVLILNANNISELKLQCKRENYVNIMKMVFRNNKIKFTNMEVINFVKKLKEFKVLKVLNLENNPFETDTQVNSKIIRGLPVNLDMYNNQKKAYVQGTIAQQPEADLAQGDAAQGGEAGGQGEEETKQSSSAMPTLEHLLYNLEAANSHPNRALEFLKQLYVDADRIKLVQATQSQSVFVQSFTKAKDTHTIKENIETFMQHAQLLVDNHFELRNIILSILSKLTIIKSHDFGVKCFYTLRDLMVAGKELEEQVMEQLNINVIKEMSNLNPKDIPVSILIGLKDLVERQQSHSTKLMSDLFEFFFPRWLNEIKMQFFRAKGQVREDESDQTDAILALLTASLRNDQDNVNKMFDKQMHDDVAEIFLKTSVQKSRYIHLLECMNEISKMHSGAASSYIEKFIHRDIMQEIKLTYYQYKKSQDLAPADNKDNIRQVVKMYRVFSAQIDLIASLLNSEPRLREKLLCDPLINELLQVLTHSNTDPILLTSICYLAYQILNCDSIRGNPEVIADQINRMQSCENLLPYLGMSKYKDLLKNTQKYNNQEEQVVQQDTTEGALEYLNDPIIHNLFIQIIKLIAFFCRQLSILVKKEKEVSNGRLDPKDSKLKAIFEQVSYRLNNAERETVLFKCLEIPNDDVRLAVVHCLLFVPIEEIEAEEIDHLLKIMSPQNIGAGKTELVLSVIFNILSNMISETSVKAIETTNLFKTKFSYAAINLAINILSKNQLRVVEDLEEETEKFTLSLSIVNFLKHVSKESKTKDQLKNKGDVLRNILYAEQQYTHDQSFVECPIEVETTQLGMDFESLRNAIAQGQDSIDPYNYISFRILHQMANLLQSNEPKGTYEPFILGEKASDFIIEAYQGNLQNKIEFENQFWRSDASSNEQQDYDDAEFNKEQKKHHKVFTNKAGVKGILHFLTAQRNNVENWLRQNNDQAIDHAGSKEKHLIFGRGLKYQIKKEMKKLQKAGSGAKHNKQNGLGKAAQTRGAQAEVDEGNTKDGTQEMLQSFQEQELGSGFVVTDTDLYLQARKASTITSKLKERGNLVMGIQNQKARSLCISAFLRCLYGSIESAPNGEYHEKAIENLKSDKFFIQITQLCASTGWLQANIGSKYFQVMRYITRVNTTKRLEDSAHLLRYEIMSIVIKRILGLLKSKIKNENNNQELSDDDQNLLSHLVVISNQMVSQSTLFDFRSKRESYEEFELQNMRETRYKLIDFMMSKLFPLDQVQIIIDVLFQEMQNAQNRLHGHKKKTENEGTGKSILEHTKKFLTQYLAYCDTNKYQVLQYMMHNKEFVGKNIREGFLEEILEGTNQIKVSNLHFQRMSQDDASRFDNENLDESDQRNNDIVEQGCRTLSYKNRQEIDIWLMTQGKKELPAKRDEEEAKREEIAKDCSLGERILFSQAMNMHVQYMSGSHRNNYKVFNLVLTNQGVYIIDDQDESFKQDPQDRENAQNEETKAQEMYRGPTKVERFNYSCIKKVSFSKHITQRIVLNVERFDEHEVQNEALYEDLDMNQNNNQTPGQSLMTPNPNMTAGNMSTAGHPNMSVRREGKKMRRKTKQQLYVTMVVPNSLDSDQIRRIFEDAIIQTATETDDGNEQSAESDLLLNYIIMKQIYEYKLTKKNARRAGGQELKSGLCPFCDKSLIEGRDGLHKCSCKYHIVYAYMFKKGQTLKICQKSKQRGGAARLMHTPIQEHIKSVDVPYQRRRKDQVQKVQVNLRKGFTEQPISEEKLPGIQPQFGVLVISTESIYFMKEDPQKWKDFTNKKTNESIQKIFQNLNSDDTQGGADHNPSFKLARLVTIKKIEENEIANYVEEIPMKKINALHQINGRVPTLELGFKNVKNDDDKVFLSMMSDYNLQETLKQIKYIKGQGASKNEDDYD